MNPEVASGAAVWFQASRLLFRTRQSVLLDAGKNNTAVLVTREMEKIFVFVSCIPTNQALISMHCLQSVAVTGTQRSGLLAVHTARKNKVIIRGLAEDLLAHLGWHMDHALNHAIISRASPKRNEHVLAQQ